MSETPNMPIMPLAEIAKEPTQVKRSIFLTPSNEPRYWTLWYRKRNRLFEKSFSFEGTMEQTVLRCRKHCQIMQYLFILVRPMVVDLDYQENQFLNGRYKDEQEGGDL